ncbi:MAG: hypothetical protein ABEK16_06325 [Candidatus Nanohalobium sp.]
MHRKSAVLVAGLILAAGMGSAGVLESFGIISGTVDVEGPTFYAADGKVLQLDVPEGDEKVDYLGVGPKPGDVEYFSTRDLGGKEWYDLEAEMYVEVKAQSGVENASLNLQFNYRDSSGDWNGCGKWVNFETQDSYHTVSVSCDLDVPGDVEKFQYVIEARDDLGIQATGGTRVEVNAQ